MIEEATLKWFEQGIASAGRSVEKLEDEKINAKHDWKQQSTLDLKNERYLAESDTETESESGWPTNGQNSQERNSQIQEIRKWLWESNLVKEQEMAQGQREASPQWMESQSMGQSDSDSPPELIDSESDDESCPELTETDPEDNSVRNGPKFVTIGSWIVPKQLEWILSSLYACCADLSYQV